MIFFNRHFFYYSLFIVFIYAPFSFAQIFADHYDKKTDSYTLLYNAQRTYIPYSIIDFVTQNYGKKSRFTKVNVVLFVWDCEKMTRKNFSGFWFTLFGSRKKRDRYLKMCEEDTEAMEDASLKLQYTLNKVNQEVNAMDALSRRREFIMNIIHHIY